MERRQKPGEELLPDKTDRDQALKDDLNMEVNIDDLAFDEEKNSYEIDVKSEDPDYIHPDPYDTAVENGGDADSDFDEANPTAVNEYDKNLSLETDLDELGMHIDNGNIVEVLPIDEQLSRTPEDDRDDLDEEGYPKNDRI
ncbi:hypothetical protein [Daejeonella lutea]|uniref:Uncharacterized protein n=1 Tax=Daejeonella lutea TaxID=572036 RepID=A0A1T5BX78_9SPHI|nr:hypothetical protein [Daejeonella lutea]SKB51978.1 hypothetical protein SAMN05661099_1711 [Daejeonella lutea]